MAVVTSVIKDINNKVKCKLDPYLRDNQISPFLDFIEQKLHLERSIVMLGMLLEFFFVFCNVFFSHRSTCSSCDLLCSWLGK